MLNYNDWKLLANRLARWRRFSRKAAVINGIKPALFRPAILQDCFLLVCVCPVESCSYSALTHLLLLLYTALGCVCVSVNLAACSVQGGGVDWLSQCSDSARCDDWIRHPVKADAKPVMSSGPRAAAGCRCISAHLETSGVTWRIDECRKRDELGSAKEKWEAEGVRGVLSTLDLPSLSLLLSLSLPFIHHKDMTAEKSFSKERAESGR